MTAAIFLIEAFFGFASPASPSGRGVIAAAWGLNTPALAAAVLFAGGLVALVPGMRSPIN